MEEQCSGSLCHFGRGFWNDKSVCIIVGGRTLCKLIVSSRTRGGPHAQEGLHVFFHSPWNAAALPCMGFLRPMATCLLEGSEEDSSNWSYLPLLLLWMIKDRLDFFDNAKVAQVCRHWWQASINNPTKLQTVGDDGMPWIMVKSNAHAEAGGNNKCMREFINLERSKKFVVEMPEFQHYCHPLFSSKGWILFKWTTKGRGEDSLFLINPLTKRKIQVGDLVRDGDLKGHCLHKGCFTNGQDGFPNSVVLYYTKNGFRTIRLYITTITYPPDGSESSSSDQVVWTKQSYVVKGFFGDVPGMTVINSHVYMPCIHGEMIIYDMSDQTWKEIPAPPLIKPNRPVFRFMEREGDLVLFLSLTEKWFFKYSHAHNSWQRMANNDDANNLMIFGKHNYSNLTIPIPKGLYDYMISYEQGGKCHIYCYDYWLKKSTTLLLMNNVEALWVDIG